MKNSKSSHPQVSEDGNRPSSERISGWLRAEMEIAGGKDMPIHIDTDIEDDDDPFQKQPKCFLLTEEKKELMAQELEERKDVHVIRRYRRTALQKRRNLLEAERQSRTVKRIRQKTKRSFAILPPEMILEVIRHTRLEDLPNFVRTERTVYSVFHNNKAAIPVGIEDTQFSDFLWLFGSNRQRSAEQKQAFMDYISSHQLHNFPTFVLELFSDQVQQGRLNEWFTIERLQEAKDTIIGHIESYKSMGIHLEVRSALYLGWISGARYTVLPPVDTKTSHGDDKSRIVTDFIPMQEQIEMFEKQPATIQANIRDVLERTMVYVIGYLDQSPLRIGGVRDPPLLGQETMHWIGEYYGPDKVDRKMKQEDMKGWLGGLAAGYMLVMLLPEVARIGPDLKNVAAAIRRNGGFFKDILQSELENSGSTDELFEEGRMFAARIGLDMGKILEGTVVGEYLESLEEQQAGVGQM